MCYHKYMKGLGATTPICETREDGILVLELPSQESLQSFRQQFPQTADAFVSRAFNGRKTTYSIALQTASRDSGIDLPTALRILYPGIEADSIEKITYRSPEQVVLADMGRQLARHASGIQDILDGKVGLSGPNDGWSIDTRDLDPEDVLFKIKQKFPRMEDFLRLSFDEMLEEFSSEGTSSKALFDLMLEKGKESYLAQHSEDASFFVELKQKLLSFGETTKESGAPKKVVDAYPPFVQYAAMPMMNLADLKKTHGDSQGEHLFALNLGRTLLIELWDLIAKEDTGDNEKRQFIQRMYELCYGTDRQFGYVGRRASIAINCLRGARSDHEDDKSSARLVVALLALLREVSKEVTDREEFWPYSVDSKSFSSSLHS